MPAAADKANIAAIGLNSLESRDREKCSNSKNIGNATHSSLASKAAANHAVVHHRCPCSQQASAARHRTVASRVLRAKM
jgi:hypothetical protein